MIIKRVLENEAVYNIPNFENEEDMQEICDKISNIFRVSIVDITEGPGTTVWTMKVADNDLLLVNNSWGNFLKPKDGTAKDFIEQQLDVFNRIL